MAFMAHIYNQWTEKGTRPWQTKQQNLVRCSVVVVQEVEIAPVRDGPGWEHHDDCEHNRLRQWQTESGWLNHTI